MKSSVGAVVIGRNEGERLHQCLASLVPFLSAIVYVDSGSSDGSVAHALGLGVEVVELDMSTPFTAARARNEGFAQLMARHPDLTHVQFVDGDCEVVDRWLDTAWRFLRDHPACAVACGRRRERFPGRSVYNRLCDHEWDTPVGEAESCGGDAMMRTDAFKAVGGYRGDVIAGEEPELCLRLRLAGWQVWRLPAEMTLHDAAILRFGQWWTRSVRSGHAYAEGAWMHGLGPQRHWVKENIRALVWTLGPPALVVALLSVFGPWALAVLGVYPLQVMRLRLKTGSWASAWFSVLSRFAEMTGIVRFYLGRWRGGARRIIEYK